MSNIESGEINIENRQNSHLPIGESVKESKSEPDHYIFEEARKLLTVPESFDNVIRVEDYKNNLVLSDKLSENKYRLGWFTKLSNLIQMIEVYGDERLQECLPQINVFWKIIRKNIEERNVKEKQTNIDMFSTPEFVSLVQEFNLSENEKKIMLLYLVSGSFDTAIEMLWNKEEAKKMFIQKSSLVDYFKDKFDYLVKKFADLRKQNIMIPVGAVEAGKEILKIILGENKE